MRNLLAQRLRAARGAINPPLTQRDIARRLALSPSAVNLWEQGKTEPSAHHLAVMAELYGVSCDWLLGIEALRQPLAAKPGAVHTVPLVEFAAMARWHWPEVSAAVQTQLEYPPQTAAATVVASDACAAAPPGAVIVVSRGHECSPGALVVAVVGDAAEPVLRRFVREGGADMLLADDSRYPTFRLADGVRLVGRVTEVLVRKLMI